MNLPTKTIHIKEIACKERKTFFYNLKKYVFQYVIENEDIFLENGVLNQYIHESAQQKQERDAYNKMVKKKNEENPSAATYKKQHPLYVQSLVQKNMFTLNAFSDKGVASLNLWLQLFKTKISEEAISKLTISTIESQIKIAQTKPNITYKSNNWIPFRNCKSENGFYYNMDKTPKKLANFEERLKKNLETFIVKTCNQPNFNLETLWLVITNLETLGEQLALNHQKKQFFKVEFECNYNLPDLFSLGQNVAYGNGVFVKEKETYENKKTHPKTDRK